jgi:hypothetical protein
MLAFGEEANVAGNGGPGASNLSPVGGWRHARGWRALVAILLLTAFVAAGITLVYLAGGTKLSALHLLYIPILLAAYTFGISGAIIAVLAAGLGLGPYMPIDTATGAMQSTQNWVLRLVYFAIVGGMAALLFRLLDQRVAAVRQLAKKDSLTGLLHGHAIERALGRFIDEAQIASGQVRNPLALRQALGEGHFSP